MKLKLLLVILFISGYVFAQKMNKFGHYITPNPDSSEYEYKFSEEKGSELLIGNLKLTGSSGFKTPFGYITLHGSHESEIYTVRLYSFDGEELFRQSFSQTINFVLSPNKLFCAFHDGEHIQLLDLKNIKLTAFKGSNVFSVNDAGQLAYYDDKASSFNFSDLRIHTDQAIYKILYFEDKPVWLTKNELYHLENARGKLIYKSNASRLFDAAVFNEILYFSTKKETPGEFIFNSFSTKDLQQFTPEEESHFPLANNKIKPNQNINTRGNMLPGETFRGPLNYSVDQLYQAVGNSYNEMQNYGSSYLHPGVDLMGTFLQDVHAVKDGFVKAILTTGGWEYWRIAIANKDIPTITDGYLYAHIEQSSFPYAVGDAVNEGDVIGQLTNFPVPGFVHCHFARIYDEGATWNGGWWTYDNPLSFMSNLVDNTAPVFEKSISSDPFAFRDIAGNYLSPDNLFGNVKVISKVYDQVNADWHIGINNLRYNISPLASPNQIIMDSASFDIGYPNDFYLSGNYYKLLLNTIYSHDIICESEGDYNNRDFYYIVTNSDGNDTLDTNDALQIFNTENLADGSYIFRVIATDASGNSSKDSMIISINNDITSINELTDESQISISPNPFNSKISLSLLNPENKSIKITIRDVMGREVYDRNVNNSSDSINEELDLNFLVKGIYFVEAMVGGKRTLKKVVKN